MVPPEIFVTTPVAPVKPNEGVVAQPPELHTLTVPPDCVYVMNVFALARRALRLRVPPSTVNAAPTPAPMTLVPIVPTLSEPAESRSEPLFVGEPLWPTIVALASFSQSPPVAGMV